MEEVLCDEDDSHPFDDEDDGLNLEAEASWKAKFIAMKRKTTRALHRRWEVLVRDDLAGASPVVFIRSLKGKAERAKKIRLWAGMVAAFFAFMLFSPDGFSGFMLTLTLMLIAVAIAVYAHMNVDFHMTLFRMVRDKALDDPDVREKIEVELAREGVAGASAKPSPAMGAAVFTASAISAYKATRAASKRK